MRAVSVRVDDVAGVAGFIAPGNKVDIIASDNQTGRSYILLSNIKVLAIDQIASTEQDKPSVVRSLTLEVNLEDTRILVKGMRNGQLQFALRNPLDDKKLASELVNTPSQPEEQKVQSQPLQAIHATTPRQRKNSLTIVPWPTQQSIQEKGKEKEKESNNEN
jgi:pilus assembly protein CpaB